MSGQAPGCATCGAAAAHRRTGEQVDGWTYLVALAGNPNTGKSTVFNALTGLRQHTGNWPGKTIARAEGGFRIGEDRYRIVDLPGTYSLLSASPDEEVARNFILFGRPDVTIIVADATRLERNLNLALQILQITNRAVVCVNLMDEARAHGIDVDTTGLARDLGVPVIPASARSGEGIDALLRAVRDVATGALVCDPRPVRHPVPALRQAVDQVARRLREAWPDLMHAEWIAQRLLAGDDRIRTAVATGRLGDLAEGLRLEEEVAV